MTARASKGAKDSDLKTTVQATWGWTSPPSASSAVVAASQEAKDDSTDEADSHRVETSDGVADAVSCAQARAASARLVMSPQQRRLLDQAIKREAQVATAESASSSASSSSATESTGEQAKCNPECADAAASESAPLYVVMIRFCKKPLDGHDTDPHAKPVHHYACGDCFEDSVFITHDDFLARFVFDGVAAMPLLQVVNRKTASRELFANTKYLVKTHCGSCMPDTLLNEPKLASADVPAKASASTISLSVSDKKRIEGLAEHSWFRPAAVQEDGADGGWRRVRSTAASS